MSKEKNTKHQFQINKPTNKTKVKQDILVFRQPNQTKQHPQPTPRKKKQTNQTHPIPTWYLLILSFI